MDLPEKQSKFENDKELLVDNRKRGFSLSKKQRTKSSENNGFKIPEGENWLKVEYSLEQEEIVENDSSENVQVTVENDSSDLSADIGNTSAPLQLENLSELDEKVASLITRSPDNIWHCTECSYGSKHNGHVKEHVENHIEGISIPCQTCPRVFRKRSIARRHSCTSNSYSYVVKQ